MSKIDELKTRINKIEDELGVTYDQSTYVDEINSSSTYLLYKYMQLLELKDDISVRKDLEGADKLIEAIETKDLDSLTTEEKSLLALKDDITSEIENKNSNIDEVSKKYKCEGEYSKIIWEPNSKYFATEFMEKHRDELNGIVDVNKETIDLLQEENDKFFKDKESSNDESEEETKTINDIEQITIDRMNDKYEPLEIIEHEEDFEEDLVTEEVIFEELHEEETTLVTEEEALEVRERLQAHFEGVELSEEQKETIEELNYLFQMGRFDEYKLLAEAEINNETVEEESADPDVIEAMSDELIDQTIDKNFVASIEHEAEAADEIEM